MGEICLVSVLWIFSFFPYLFALAFIMLARVAIFLQARFLRKWMRLRYLPQGSLMLGPLSCSTDAINRSDRAGIKAGPSML